MGGVWDDGSKSHSMPVVDLKGKLKGEPLGNVYGTDEVIEAYRKTRGPSFLRRNLRPIAFIIVILALAWCCCYGPKSEEEPVNANADPKSGKAGVRTFKITPPTGK